MVVESGTLNVGGSPAVVVDDGHPVAGLHQIQGLDLLRAVGVHHHHQRAVVRQQQSLLGGEEAVLILLQMGQLVHQHLSRGRARLPDDVGRDPLLPGDGAHAGGGAHAVVVGGLVAHDKHLGGVGHQGGQGVGHDTAFYLGALFRLLGAAAVELEGELVAYHRLVAAPGQGHVDGQVGKLEQLPIVLPVLAHADGEGGGDAAGIGNLADGVQNVKFLFDKPGQILLLKDVVVPVPLHPAEHAVGVGHPGVQTGVDLGVDGGALVLRQVFHQVLVVVQQQHRHHRAGGQILVPGLTQLGDVHPVGGGQEAAALVAGAHQVAVDHKPAAAEAHVVGTLVFALQQPPGVKAGDNGGELGVEEVLPVAGEAQEAVVGPDDIVALRTEDPHGQGGVDHGIFCGHIHVAGDIFNVLGDLPAALVAAGAGIQPQDQHHHSFQHRQRNGKQGGGQGKQDQDHKIQLHTGLEKLGYFSVQERKPPFCKNHKIRTKLYQIAGEITTKTKVETVGIF